MNQRLIVSSALASVLAMGLIAQVSAAGIDGVVFGFLDYNEELKFFDSAVMPLLSQAGLRS